MVLVLVTACRTVSAPPFPGLEPGQFDSAVSEQELKQFPPRDVPGDLPETGLRHWSPPLWRLPYRGCYVTVLRRPAGNGAGLYEMWQNGWGPGISDRDIRVRRGMSIGKLGTQESVFDGSLIDDVPVPALPRSLEAKEPWELSPVRGYTRPSMIHDSENGYVLMACVCPDYQPGSVTLMPAILTSPTGQAGTWTYHGMITGEPQEEQAKRGSPVWSDGGSLFRLSDGTWRMYVNGFGQTLAVLHAKSLDGPWLFVRENNGAIRELILPNDGWGPEHGCFPHVLSISESEWHFWVSDRWPCQSVWHFWSRDGLTWEPYGRQPEITRSAVNGHGIKCLRTFASADGHRIVGLLSVWTEEPERGQKSWQLHLTTMPVGPPR